MNLIRALGGTAVTAAMLAMPSTAWAAAADEPPQLVALANASAGDQQTYRPFHAGESLPVKAGIANVGAAPVRGVVVDLYITGEMELPRDWTNCEYYGDDGVDGAWCEFDSDLQAATSYLLSPLSIAGRADAIRIKYPHSLNITWYPKAYASERGGIHDLAQSAPSQGGREPVKGTKVPLSLSKADLPVPAGEGDSNPRAGVAFYFVLRTATPTPTIATPPTDPPGHPSSPEASDSPEPTGTATTTSDPAPSSPTTTATVTPTATDPAAGVPATTPPADGQGGSGGGLALTGSNTALVAGGGLVLLLAGAGGYLITRRRRTKFVA
ncbi:hypothetical protein [Paractinoplanes maris]|uniref:hypothetical protein n=1 Tax=Paractinoplanes maris TaxID=1734446 RepID=UPI002021B1D9|nr:hypothetical protein [Actinoplanes maris]